MQAFSKILRPGTVKCGGRWASLFVEVDWDGSRLSITGVEGPNRHGNALGGCGQVGIDKTIRPAKGWTRGMIAALRSAWDRWHLNDMKAGTPAQQAAVDEWTAGGAQYDYSAACDMLKLAGLYTVPDPRDPSQPYAYGTAWIKEAVPADVLAMLAVLPESDQPYPWTRHHPVHA